MPATFWTGSNLSFTNGSKTVTVNTGSPLSSIRPNSSLTTSNYNEPVEIESAVGNIITLYSPWPGSTGDFAATITPSAATVAAAGQAAQEVVQEIKTLVSGSSVAASANSFVKRDTNGCVKTATPVANDDAVNKGYLGTAARKNVQTTPTDSTAGALMMVGSYGIGSVNAPEVTSGDANAITATGIYRVSTVSYANLPAGASSGACIIHTSFSSYFSQQIYLNGTGSRVWIRGKNNNVWGSWQELHHTGNTNFNEFGGQGAVVIAVGFATNSSQAVFQLYTQSDAQASSITIPAGATFRVTNATFSDLKADIPASDISLMGARSGKVTTVIVSNLSNLTVGQPLYLYAANASSKITVNF